MRDFFKSIGMLLPPLRQLHEERNRYALAVDMLSKKLDDSEDINKYIQIELESLRLKNNELLSEINKLEQSVLSLSTEKPSNADNPDSLIFQSELVALLQEKKIPHFFDGSKPLFVSGRSSNLPRAFVISVPKAGTYLVSTYLERLGYVNAGVHLSQFSLTDYRNKSIDDMIWKYKESNFDLPLHEALSMLDCGQFSVGHLAYSKENWSALKDFRCIFLVRDLRGALISLMRWFLKRKMFSSTSSLALELDPKKQVLNFLISEAPKHFEWYQSVVDWEDSGCKHIRFEDLLNTDPMIRKKFAYEVAEYLDIVVTPQSALNILDSIIGQPTKTWSGGLSDVSFYWSDEAETVFKDSGWFTLNSKLGYE